MLSVNCYLDRECGAPEKKVATKIDIHRDNVTV